MIDVENLCKWCMREMTPDQENCPMCGFNRKQKLERSEKCLPADTILNGRYLIGRVLGEGGFGITYLALDLVQDQPVAVKEYFPMGLVSRNMEGTGNTELSILSGEQRNYYRNGLKRFSEEAQNLRKFCEYPGIVTARDFFNANGTAYLVMDYIEGQSLKQYMKWYMQSSPGHVPMDYRTAIAFLEPVMKSLAQMHQAGLIHRDISPDNILVDKDGKVTLIDFGAARVDMGDELRSMTVMVKHGYAPEEQYRRHGRQGTWTDVYALCATLYHMISGKLPEESVERLYRDEVEPLKKLSLVMPVPETISDTIEKGMAVRAENRCQTVGELWQKLKEALDKQDEQERLEQEAQRKQEEKTRQENVGHVKTISTEETYKKETGIDIEKRTQKSGKQNKKVKIIVAILCICIAGLGGWAGVNWLKDQSHYVKLTDYVSLDSYIEGDSKYILSKKEVEKLKIWKDDYNILYLHRENTDEEEQIPSEYVPFYSLKEKQILFMKADGTLENQDNSQKLLEKMKTNWTYKQYYPVYIRGAGLADENGTMGFTGTNSFFETMETNSSGELPVMDICEPLSDGFAAVSFVTYDPMERYWGYMDAQENLRVVFRSDITGGSAERKFVLRPLAACQDYVFLVGYRDMDGLNRDGNGTSSAGGYYLFDQNGKLLKEFDKNYELGAFMPCGLALVHDFTEIMALWDECEDSAQFSERLKEAHENGTQEDWVDAWYINTNGEQVGETMHMSIYDLADFEEEVFGYYALIKYSDWLPDWYEKYQEQI